MEKAFKREYGLTLERMIHADTFGPYRRLLIAMLGDDTFSAEREAKTLRNSMRGLGAKKVRINQVLAKWTGDQRQLIREAYDSMYKRDLLKDLNSELMHDHRNLAIALFTPPDKFGAQEVNRAIKGLGTDDASLIEILCSRTGYEMGQIRVSKPGSNIFIQNCSEKLNPSPHPLPF